MKLRIQTTIFLLIVTALLSMGCEQKKVKQVRPEQAQSHQEILIGLIPEQNVFRQRERYQSLKKYLYEKTGISVNFTSLSRYGNIVEHFTAEKLDGAFFGSFTYALAHHQLGVEPLARPVNLDGTSTYHGYLFVRKDSGIRTVEQLRGKRFSFVERATTAGYLFPIAYFREKGVFDLQGFLGESIFTGSHDASILAVLNREAEAGAAKNTIYDQLAIENPRIEKELQIIASSGVVPQNCLAVRRDLDPAVKGLLKEALLKMNENADGERTLRQFGARGFIETQDSDYDYLYKLTAEVGIDLKTYRYRNQ